MPYNSDGYKPSLHYERPAAFTIATAKEHVDVTRLVVNSADLGTPSISHTYGAEELKDLAKTFNGGRPITFRVDPTIKKDNLVEVLDKVTGQIVAKGINQKGRGIGTYMSWTEDIAQLNPDVISFGYNGAPYGCWPDMVEKAREHEYAGWAGVKPDDVTTLAELEHYSGVLSPEQMYIEELDLYYEALRRYQEVAGLGRLELSHQWLVSCLGSYLGEFVRERVDRDRLEGARRKVETVNALLEIHDVRGKFALVSGTFDGVRSYQMVPSVDNRKAEENFVREAAERVFSSYSYS